MKKQFLTLIAFAAGVSAAYAQCGSVTTVHGMVAEPTTVSLLPTTGLAM
jgi:hypothetical protein